MLKALNAVSHFLKIVLFNEKNFYLLFVTSRANPRVTLIKVTPLADR